MQILRGLVQMSKKLKKIHLLQKRAVRFVFNEYRLSHPRPLLQKISALKVYQINLYQHLNFMHKLNNQENPRIFNDLIKRPVHKYSTNFSKSNFHFKIFLLIVQNTKFLSVVQNYGMKFSIKKKKN